MTLPPLSESIQYGVGYMIPKNALQCDPMAVETLNRYRVTMNEIIRAKKWLMFSDNKLFVYYQIWALPSGMSITFKQKEWE